MTTKKTLQNITFAAVLGAGLLTLGGCQSGHGEYTDEALDNANMRVRQMKAMTSHDMARQQFLAGDLKKALRTIEESIAFIDSVPVSFILKGRIQIELNRLEQALQSFDFALGIDLAEADQHKVTEAHYYKGIIFERFNQPTSALQSYHMAMELEPSNVQYIIASAEMYIEMDKLFDAQQLLENNRRQFEHNAGIRQTLGHIAMMRGDHELAAELFEEAALLGSGDPTLREDQLRAQMALGLFKEADRTLSWLLRDPDFAGRYDLRLLHAKVLLKLDRPVESRELLLSLTSSGQGRNDAEAWIDLGNTALVLDDLPRLRTSGQRLVAIAPSRADGYMFIALYQRQRGQLEAAVAILFDGLRSVRHDSRIAVLQGMMYQDLGNDELARRSFNIAMERDPADEDAQMLLASMRYEPTILAQPEQFEWTSDSELAGAEVDEDNDR